MINEAGIMIRDCRGQQHQYTVRSGAAELGVSASYLSDIELGRRKLNMAMAGKIARTFGIDYEELLTAAGLMSDERSVLIQILGELNIGVPDIEHLKDEIREGLGGEWLCNHYYERQLFLMGLRAETERVRNKLKSFVKSEVSDDDTC